MSHVTAMDNKESPSSDGTTEDHSPSAASLLASVQSHDSTVMELPLFEAKLASTLRKVPDAIAWPGTTSLCPIT